MIHASHLSQNNVDHDTNNNLLTNNNGRGKAYRIIAVAPQLWMKDGYNQPFAEQKTGWPTMNGQNNPFDPALSKWVIEQ